MRMSESVSMSYRNDGLPWDDGSQKLGGRRSAAAVVTDLEHVRAQSIVRVGKQRGLFLALGISNKEK